jgi:asparagine synthase (glutamine-hydrolysing)
MEDSDLQGFVVSCGSGSPVIDVYGGYLEGEFSQYHHRDAVLLVTGQCLVEGSRRAAEFARAVDNSADGRFLSALAEWPGSYSVVALRHGGAEACVDPAGQFPLYYSRRGDETLIGSNPGLLAVRHHRAVDPVTAAARIACPTVLPLWSGRSAYEGVARLEGADVLRVESSGAQLVDSSRWPLPVPGRTRAEGARMLRQALVSAVRARCGSQGVSCDFSGGLDSTSIAFLAAAATERPLPAVLYHQPLAPAGDLAEAVRFSRLDPMINLLVASGSRETLPFSALMASNAGGPLPEPVEPTPQFLAGGASALRLAVALSSGARLHLTGEGADALLLPSPSYLGRFARARDAGALLRHCAGYGRLRYASPATLAHQAFRVAHTTPARALRLLASELRCPEGLPLRWADLISWWSPSGEAATWLAPGMRRQLAEIADDPATATAVPNCCGPADLAAVADLRRSGDAHRYLRQLGAGVGLAVHAPFLDLDVVRSALSVPSQERTEPWSYKPLLGAAMAGLVPPAVLGRRTKGDYSAEEYRGARGSAKALRGLLRDCRLADLGVIEPNAVMSALDRMTSGVAVPIGQMNTLLATEIWLRGTEARIGVSARC